MDVPLINAPKSVTVLLKIKAPASVNSKVAVQFISPSALYVPVEIVTLPPVDIVLNPFTSSVLVFTSNIVEDAVTVKLLVTLVAPCKVLVAPPDIIKL